VNLDDIRARCVIDNGCWLWSGAMSKGWPRIWAPDYTNHNGELKTQTGRRAVWHVKTGGAIPAGWRVFGNCRNRNCIAPHHMECRPVAEEGARVAASEKLKGQVTRIAANRAIGRKRSHLTPELIELIRTSPKTGTAIAAETGLSRATVSRVRVGKALAFDAVGGLFTGLLAANEHHRRAA
jgi:plasmid stabilization system protein ParE